MSTIATLSSVMITNIIFFKTPRSHLYRFRVAKPPPITRGQTALHWRRKVNFTALHCVLCTVYCIALCINTALRTRSVQKNFTALHSVRMSKLHCKCNTIITGSDCKRCNFALLIWKYGRGIWSFTSQTPNIYLQYRGFKHHYQNQAQQHQHSVVVLSILLVLTEKRGRYN